MANRANRATVVFASTETFEAGDQLAACLRRRKIRVELYRPPARSGLAKGLRRVSGLVYDHVDESLDDEADGPDITELRIAVSDPDVVGVQATDHTLEPLVAALVNDPDVVRRVCSASDPLGMIDKRWQADVAKVAGLSVPEVWLDPADVTEFPVLVKPILGGGGTGIRPAANRAELDVAWRDATGDDDTFFIQQRLVGRTMHVGGVAKGGEPVVIAAYEGEGSQQFGQISSGRLVVDAPAVTAATNFLRAAGYTGIFCFDLIRTESGEHYFIEVNPRIFGSWMTLQLAGVDVVGAYLFALGLGERPPTATPDYATTWQLKHPSEATAGQLLKAGLGRVRTMGPYLGWRGSAVMTVDLMAHIRRTR